MEYLFQINRFHNSVSYLDPLKTSENPLVILTFSEVTEMEHWLGMGQWLTHQSDFRDLDITIPHFSLPVMCMFKVINGFTKFVSWILCWKSLLSRHLLVQSQQGKYQNNVNNVVLVSFLLTLNRFHTLFWCFDCWLWTSKYRLGCETVRCKTTRTY